MVEPPTGVYGGISAADRHAERRERLLDAGLELLGSQGWNATSVRGVCAQAKLSPRYFYESFDDLDALLVAVFDRVVGEATVAVLEALQTAPWEAHERTRVAIGAFVESLTDDPRKGRVAFVEALGSERLMRRRLETMRQLSGFLAAEATAFYGATEDTAPLVDLTASLLVGGLTELLMGWLDGHLKMDRQELIEDCAELWVAVAESAVALAQRRLAQRGT